MVMFRADLPTTTTTGTLHLSSPCKIAARRMPQKLGQSWLRQRYPSQPIMPPARVALEIVEPLSTAAAPPDLTWQITVGAIAGVTPFVVAGIEFSKRIIQQRRCQVCGASGLVKRAGILVRCNGCELLVTGPARRASSADFMTGQYVETAVTVP